MKDLYDKLLTALLICVFALMICDIILLVRLLD